MLVIGAGGLGAPVLQYLAAAGVGTLGIADDDRVSLSNLQRQVIHDSGTIGELKTESAAFAIARLNPHVNVSASRSASSAGVGPPSSLGLRSADRRLRQFRHPLCRGRCRRDGANPVGDGRRRPLRWLPDGAEALRDGGGWRTEPGYRDLFPEKPPAGLIPACAETGIIGALTGVIGTLMAMEAIKLITGTGEPLIGRLLLYDALAGPFRYHPLQATAPKAEPTS